MNPRPIDFVGAAVLAIVLMGAMTGVLTALVAMQYYKVQASDPMRVMEES